LALHFQVIQRSSWCVRLFLVHSVKAYRKKELSIGCSIPVTSLATFSSRETYSGFDVSFHSGQNRWPMCSDWVRCSPLTQWKGISTSCALFTSPHYVVNVPFGSLKRVLKRYAPMFGPCRVGEICRPADQRNLQTLQGPRRASH
jgi:hypothetical protein